MDVIRKLKWTETAIKQRNNVFEYWNYTNKSNSYSKKLNLKIKERIAILKSFPELGIATDFFNTRVLYVSYYSILYQFSENYIIINGFWDNRQDDNKLLDFLKNV